MHLKFVFLLLLPLMIITGSCNKIYWQRNKVRAVIKNPPTIEVQIENTARWAFTEHFNDGLKKTCEKEFTRMGYSTEVKDTPDYIAIIRIGIDSFAVNNVYVVGKGGPSMFWRPYQKTKVYAILFDYRITSTRYKTTKWKEENDIYYFEDTYRNSRRSNNMVKYTIRFGK